MTLSLPRLHLHQSKMPLRRSSQSCALTPIPKSSSVLQPLLATTLQPIQMITRPLSDFPGYEAPPTHLRHLRGRASARRDYLKDYTYLIVGHEAPAKAPSMSPATSQTSKICLSRAKRRKHAGKKELRS